MRHRMRRPDVARIEGDRAPAGPLRVRIGAVLLQTEGHIAQHEAVPGIGLAPTRQHAGDGIPHRAAVAEIEMREMGEPEGEHVTGMVEQDLLPYRRGRENVAAAPGIQRRDMALFALRGALPRQLPRRRERFLGLALERRRAEQLHEVAAGAMRHRHLRVRREHVLQPVAGILPQAQIVENHRVVAARRVDARGGRLQAVLVADHAVLRSAIRQRRLWED